MTAQEMEYEWKITYEAIASMAAPGYTSREISVFLTQAHEEIAIELAKQWLDNNDYARTALNKLLFNYAYNIPSSLDTTIFPSNAYRVTISNITDYYYPVIEYAVTHSDGVYTAFTQDVTVTNSNPVVTFNSNITILSGSFIRIKGVVYKVSIGTTTTSITLYTNYTGTTETIAGTSGLVGSLVPGTRVAKPIDYASYYTNISNPWAKPYKDLYWRVYEKGYLTIITDGTPLASWGAIQGVFLIKPTPIITANISPNTIDGLSTITDMSTAYVLSPIVHREIVYRAAKKAFAAQKDQTGYQIQNNEENN